MNVLKVRQPMQGRSVYSSLETIDVVTGECKVLCELDYLIEAPNWMKDGNTLVYNSGGHIYTYDIISGMHTLTQSGVANRCNNDHVLSPDNKQIAISHNTVEDGQSRIYSMPIKGGIPTLLTPIAPSYLHGWSPDGKTLCYCAERNGEYDIYTIPVDGGVETQLTNVLGLNDGPEYSPCGKHIWFNSVRTGLMQVWRMNVDGSEQIQITFDDYNNWFPHVSPDGTKVVYISYNKDEVAPSDHPANKNVEIRMMNYDGTDCRTLVKLFGGQGSLNVNSWAPDGKQLAFVSYRLK